MCFIKQPFIEDSANSLHMSPFIYCGFPSLPHLSVSSISSIKKKCLFYSIEQKGKIISVQDYMEEFF